MNRKCYTLTFTINEYGQDGEYLSSIFSYIPDELSVANTLSQEGVGSKYFGKIYKDLIEKGFSDDGYTCWYLREEEMK